MDKGRGKGTDTLPTNNVFTRKEYIEREALLDEINIAPVSMSICMNVDECKGRIYERERLVRIINEATAADFVPARHGRWVNICGDRESPRQCSECLQDFDYIDGICYLVSGQRLPRYCPNCGARMDGDGE